MKRRSRIDLQHHQIPAKANRILYFILIAMFLILVRIWHLTVIEYDKKVQDSRRPQQKMVIEPAIRATIHDRFNQPLAINKITYQATILYAGLKDIPTFEWITNSDGTRKRIAKRKQYIRDFSEKIASEINMDADRIEDLIYSKASFYMQIPFVIKEDLSETEYYRLKMLEKDLPGLYTRKIPKREYPMGRTGGDVIGYMGAINKVEYETILYEISALKAFIADQEAGFDPSPSLNVKNIYEARKRLKELEAKAYTIHDYVGKTGIEAVFEKELRGYFGKKMFYTDSKGNYLKEFPGSRLAMPGNRITLTLSAELQQYAEELLAENEEIRIVRKSHLGGTKKTVLADKSPWIKGGAIVAIDIHSAEVVALASYPRFDPSDFNLQGSAEIVKNKKQAINRWFENDFYLAQLWNLQQPFKRERYNAKKALFYDEERWMYWDNYLDMVLNNDAPLRISMGNIQTLDQVIFIQEQVEALKKLFPSYDLYALFNFLYAGDFHESHSFVLKGAERQKLIDAFKENKDAAQKIKECLDPYLNHLPKNYDKVLLIDLCRLAADPTLFPKELKPYLKNFSINQHRKQSGWLYTCIKPIKEETKKKFHQVIFKKWRETNQAAFLKAKREEEKAIKTYAKPYIDYLDKEENRLFEEFWQHYGPTILVSLFSDSPTLFQNTETEPFITHLHLWSTIQEETPWKKQFKLLKNDLQTISQTLIISYLQTLRFYENLNRPLEGYYRYLRGGKKATEKDLAAAFYPLYGYGYGRSHGYRQAAIQGSLFKLVTAYEVLIQRYKKLGSQILSPQDLNPLVIIDQVYQKGSTHYVGYTESGEPIPQIYKGGRLPRSLAHDNNGRVDLIRALEVSSNPYFALIAGDHLNDPEDLSKAARLFSFGSRTGIDLPGELSGKVPADLSTNRTGLYAMSIGQHSLVVTPLQTAVMLTAIANGGKVIKPRLLKCIEDKQPNFSCGKITSPPSFPYQDALASIGINFPLFSGAMRQETSQKLKVAKIEYQREIFLPEAVRQILLKGLYKATDRTYQDSLSSLARLYKQSPDAIKQFKEMKHQLLGKTSTSESVENIDLDLDHGTNIYTHVWFGSISFDSAFHDKNKALLLLKDEFGHPELVVVVYLRYGGYGKEAAPLAAQIVKKWRELKKKYN